MIPLSQRKELLGGALPGGSGARTPLWIDGAWRPAAAPDAFLCIDPSIAEPLIEVGVATPDDIDDAVAAAWRAQPGWWRADGQDRARILRAIADGIRASSRALGTLDTLDAGRPIRDTAARDSERAARIFEFFAGTTDRLRGAAIPVQPGRTNIVEYEPIGIVGAITPWNYPMTNAAGKIAPALATGNAVILKPAEESPLSALLLAWIASRAGLPAGLLNVVNGSGASVGEAMVRHPGIGKIAFTGSTSVGQRIGKLGGELLKSLTLELGGKTAFVVFADADLDRAADALVFSAFNNAGQTCTAGSRLVVEEAVEGELIARIRQRVAAIRIGDPLDPATQVGPVISERHFKAIRASLAEAGALGLKRLDLGRRALPSTGYFLEPAMFTDVDPMCATAQNEIFGPVVTVTAFSGEDEAVAIANATRYGLATTIWTGDVSRAGRMSRQVRSGLVWINNVHSLHPGSPYGGHKQSGLGHEMGQEAIDQHMKLKSVWIDDGSWSSPWT